MKNYKEILEVNTLTPRKIDDMVKDIDWIRGLNKAGLIKNYPSRLDVEYLKSEPASVLRTEILNSKHSRKDIEKYMAFRKTPEGKSRKLPNVF